MDTQEKTSAGKSNRLSSLVFIGMPGSGKSTIGKIVSEELGLNFIDLDVYIIRKALKPLQEIINEQGEETLLQIEKQSMYEISLDHSVISPGGSIIYHPGLMKYLKKHAVIVYLEDSLENIEARMDNISVRGIIGMKTKSLQQVYEERKPLYSKYADITIHCREKSREDIVQDILNVSSSYLGKHL
jgi:shikimate kinase